MESALDCAPKGNQPDYRASSLVLLPPSNG